MGAISLVDETDCAPTQPAFNGLMSRFRTPLLVDKTARAPARPVGMALTIVTECAGRDATGQDLNCATGYAVIGDRWESKKMAGWSEEPKLRWVVVLLAGMLPILGGCGLFVPKPHEFYEAKSDDTGFVNVILNNVKCELRNAVVNIMAAPHATDNRRLAWIPRWGAASALQFTVNETGAVNPGALFTPPPPFSLGIELTSSTSATRIENVAWTYSFQDLLDEYRKLAATGKAPSTASCVNEGGILIQSDLEIGRFLKKYADISTTPGNLMPVDKYVPFDTVTYTVTFVVTYSAGISPVWKLQRVTVPSGKLLDASRSKTSNLIVTFSRVASRASPEEPATLSPLGVAAQNAAVSGQATAVSSRAIAR